jgi:hypothetical protein
MCVLKLNNSCKIRETGASHSFVSMLKLGYTYMHSVIIPTRALCYGF